jgi:PAS domain S-box-containing protein
MSLRTRLRLFVIALMISVVSALSALYAYSFTDAVFSDVLERSRGIANQVVSFLVPRINQQVREVQPPPQTPAEIRMLWANLIGTDNELAEFLVTSISNSRLVAEIQITDERGRILADSVPTQIGQTAKQLPEFGQWAQKSPWGKLREIFFSKTRDYQVSSDPIGAPNQARFYVKVILSSPLLRRMLAPEVQNIALIFLGALLASMVLAVVVSNFVLRPLHSISQAIDRISRGDFGKQPWPAADTAKEFAAVQSKLTLLGQQYHGARQDAIQLRTNIEQLLERMEEVVFLFDRDDRLVMAGRAAERLLGRGRWEIMGRTLNELFPPPSAIGAAIRNALEIRRPLKDVPLTLERDGEDPARLLVTIEMLEAFPDHQRIGTLISMRDAETRRQIQSQLDVSARLAAISRLTGGVAHEIKNPLQAITVHLELLKSKLAGEYDEVAPEIETIAREIQRLDRVVKAFLDFTRPVDLKMRDLEMAGIAREVAALVGPSAARQNVTLELDAGPGEIFVHGDRDLIQQALLNVVVNGIEAMKQGGRLQIQLRLHGDECNLSVTDEGVGIPPEIRDKIFNLYYSTKGKGSGIGLAMTFRVVQLHNGTIDFTSEPGKGTTFRLRFPAAGKTAPGAFSTAVQSGE